MDNPFQIKPVRMNFQGDKELAASHAGDAKRMLFQLKNIKRTNNSTQELTKRYEDGTVINVHSKVKGMDVVNIFSVRGGWKKEEREEIREESFPVPIIMAYDTPDSLEPIGGYVAKNFYIDREYVELNKDGKIEYTKKDKKLRELEHGETKIFRPLLGENAYGGEDNGIDFYRNIETREASQSGSVVERADQKLTGNIDVDIHKSVSNQIGNFIYFHYDYLAVSYNYFNNTKHYLASYSHYDIYGFKEIWYIPYTMWENVPIPGPPYLGRVGCNFKRNFSIQSSTEDYKLIYDTPYTETITDSELPIYQEDVLYDNLHYGDMGQEEYVLRPILCDVYNYNGNPVYMYGYTKVKYDYTNYDILDENAHVEYGIIYKDTFHRIRFKLEGDNEWGWFINQRFKLDEATYIDKDDKETKFELPDKLKGKYGSPWLLSSATVVNRNARAGKITEYRIEKK